jgi:Gluconate 2-dehydrogenase subunit 3
MDEQSWGRRFVECDAGRRTELLKTLAANEDHPQTPGRRFFVTLKRATVEGYYTSAIAIHQDLRYLGNEALPDFPGCTHPEHKR